MIYFDSYGFPVDQTSDGGDSTVRAGLLVMCNHKMAQNIDMSKYEVKDTEHIFGGQFTRHPYQEPWNNPKNWSRDQMMPFIAGLHAKQIQKPIEEFFYHRLSKCFFMQNTERDAKGTTKYPWPHMVDGKKRWFDYADPLMPNHIGAIILAGRMTGWYWFLLFAYPFHLLFLVLHSFGNHYEENQQIAECYLYGTLKWYKKIHKRWEAVSRQYWVDRAEVEYHIMLKEFLK
jgi:hypothetical protein